VRTKSRNISRKNPKTSERNLPLVSMARSNNCSGSGSGFWPAICCYSHTASGLTICLPPHFAMHVPSLLLDNVVECKLLTVWSTEPLKFLCHVCVCIDGSRGSSVSIVSGYGLDEVRFPTEARGFFLSSVSRPALGPTQPPVQWVLGVLSRG